MLWTRMEFIVAVTALALAFGLGFAIFAHIDSETDKIEAEVRRVEDKVDAVQYDVAEIQVEIARIDGKLDLIDSKLNSILDTILALLYGIADNQEQHRNPLTEAG